MSNRTFLAHSDQPFDQFGSSGVFGLPGTDHDIIAAASYCLPFLWFSLFEPGDILHIADEDGSKYPVLCAPSTLAIERTRSRMPSLQAAFPAAVPHVPSWLEKVARINKPFVLVETIELVVMDDNPHQLTTTMTTACKWWHGLTVSSWWRTPAAKTFQKIWEALDLNSCGTLDEALMGYKWID